MLFQTYGNRNHPAVLFFHAMGVTGASSEPVAKYLQDRYFCILPTSTVYCEGQKYVSKLDEIRQVEDFLHQQGVERLAMVVASSIGADLAMAFLTQTKLPVEHAFFDGGQFAQIGKGTRRIMTPFLYFAIKSLYWSKGGTLKKILWCDDDSIKPYFIAAGKNLTYTNLRRQISDSLEDKPFPPLSKKLQKHTYFEFGSIEDHFKYRQAVMEAYPCGHYPVFEGYDHMQYQIRDPKGFAEMLAHIAERDCIENHHEGIVSREKYDAVQAEMARRNAAKSPSKNAVTGMASYASKYALSERLVCGECGTLYRRCTWTRNGEKRVVWRCVSRLDYGKKYCHNSPTLDEAPLQQAILAVLNTAMADKNSLIRQITAAMETELIPFPGGTMSLGDIECRLRVLEQQFQTLLEKATDDPAAYGGQFKEILDEQTFLKEKRSVILANNNEQAKANQRIMDAAQTLENASPYITEWDESAVRQLVETVKILSKDEVAVTLKGGIEICQKIMY